MKHTSHFLNQDMMVEHVNGNICNVVVVVTVAGTLILLVMSKIGKA